MQSPSGRFQQVSHKRSMMLLRLSVILCMLLSAVHATDDVANLSPCELESIINQLVNPSAEYEMHASALRSQLKNLLRDRQLAVGEEQSLNDYENPEEDKRSVASLASLGLLRGGKRSLATLAKNGQLPTQEPEEIDDVEARIAAKRYIGALARSGGLMSYGKRNIGTLARDFQLPQNGKRNLGSLARLGLINTNREPKRNVAAVARYNSNRMGGASTAASSMAEKRNLGALKGSPVHGAHQKRDDEESGIIPGVDVDYADMVPAGYWLYPSYSDFDWETLHEQQKRFLDTSKDPELFGINNALAAQEATAAAAEREESVSSLATVASVAAEPADNEPPYQQQKRHIGSIARSGFLPSYRALRSTYMDGFGGGYGGGGVRFSRSGRARQFVEYYPQRERLRQPIAAACKRCFLPFRPVVSWSAVGGGRGSVGGAGAMASLRSLRGHSSSNNNNNNNYEDSIMSNTLPSYERRPIAAASTSTISTHWGTPPRITALHRRSFRRPTAIQSYQY